MSTADLSIICLTVVILALIIAAVVLGLKVVGRLSIAQQRKPPAPPGGPGA